jgi:hypothetical protein
LPSCGSKRGWSRRALFFVRRGRLQSLESLRADLAHWAGQSESESSKAPVVAQMKLEH